MNELNNVIFSSAVFLILLAGLLMIISLIRFSSVLTKLVVLEVLTNLLLAGICLWALNVHQPVFIDICIPLSLVMFLGVVAYFQFLSRRGPNDASVSE